MAPRLSLVRVHRLGWSTLGVLLTLMIISVGCTTAAPEPLGADTGRATISSQLEDSPVAPSDLPLDASTSPLLDFLGGGYATGNEQLSEQNLLIAQCMIDRGWQYVPNDPAADTPDPQPRQLGALIDWTRLYGYGVTITPGSGGKSREISEINQRYYESLTPEQQEAYHTDINGPLEERSESYYPTEDAWGCEHRAFLTVTEGVPINDFAVTEISGREHNAMYSDPRFVAAEVKWSACMAEKGYTYTRAVGPNAFINEESFRIDRVGDPEAWLALQQLELETAVADLDCRIATTLPIQVEIEWEVIQMIVDRFPEYTHAIPES